MRYSAFISYNHRDRDWAVWLHRALERYSVPKRLWGRPAPWGELGTAASAGFPRPRRAGDLDATSPRRSRRRSPIRHLVVICSPNSARSKWVNEEIRTFIAAGARNSSG